jgi:hypothetical protein
MVFIRGDCLRLDGDNPIHHRVIGSLATSDRQVLFAADQIDSRVTVCLASDENTIKIIHFGCHDVSQMILGNKDT